MLSKTIQTAQIGAGLMERIPESRGDVLSVAKTVLRAEHAGGLSVTLTFRFGSARGTQMSRKRCLCAGA